MWNLYNLWRTVGIRHDGLRGFHCTRCGMMKFPCTSDERLRHRCRPNDIGAHQAYIKKYGEGGW